jgi:hypothetical protein
MHKVAKVSTAIVIVVVTGIFAKTNLTMQILRQIVIKLFTSTIYTNFHNKLECLFISLKPFKFSLMFVGKSRTLP